MTYTFKLSRRMAVRWVVSCMLVSLLLALAAPVSWFSAVLPDAALALLTEAQHGLSVLSHPHIPPILAHLFVVWFGSIATQVFRVIRDFEGCQDFLRQVFPNRGKVFYARVDLLVSSTMGSMLGMIIVNPTTFKAALVTGLAWPLLVRAAVGGVRSLTTARGADDDPMKGNIEPDLHALPHGTVELVKREETSDLSLIPLPEQTQDLTWTMVAGRRRGDSEAVLLVKRPSRPR